MIRLIKTQSTFYIIKNMPRYFVFSKQSALQNDCCLSVQTILAVFVHLPKMLLGHMSIFLISFSFTCFPIFLCAVIMTGCERLKGI